MEMYIIVKLKRHREEKTTMYYTEEAVFNFLYTYRQTAPKFVTGHPAFKLWIIPVLTNSS